MPDQLTSEARVEIIRNFWRAWNEKDLDAVLALLAPEFQSHSVLRPNLPVDRETFARGFLFFRKMLPDLKEEVVTVVADDNVVACEVIETATMTGSLDLPGRSIAPTNRSYRLPLAAFFRIDSQGLITEQRTYWDTFSWSQQIGIDPRLFASV
jgi:steroid delta-isomerase-like uncharacterized protein